MHQVTVGPKRLEPVRVPRQLRWREPFGAAALAEARNRNGKLCLIELEGRFAARKVQRRPAGTDERLLLSGRRRREPRHTSGLRRLFQRQARRHLRLALHVASCRLPKTMGPSMAPKSPQYAPVRGIVLEAPLPSTSALTG